MFVLKLAPVLSRKMSFEAEIVPLLSFCDETKTFIPFFYLCFLLAMSTQKYILRRENLDSRSCTFLDINKNALKALSLACLEINVLVFVEFSEF